MNDRFEAISWWLNLETTRVSDITMDGVTEGLVNYDQHREEVAKRESDKYSGKRGKVPTVACARSTLYRHYGNVENVMDRTVKYLHENRQPVPGVLKEFLASERTGRKGSGGGQDRRSFNADTPIEDLERSVGKARAAHDDDELVIHLEQLAARYLAKAKADQVEEAKDLLGKAFEAAKSGYQTARESSKRTGRKRMLREQMLCARSAAWAAVQQSRLNIGDEGVSDKYLSHAALWKRNEEELANALRLPLTAAVARFHADRAAALLDDNLEQTIIGLRDISAYLIDHNGGGPDLNDRVRYHDLTSIIQRLCAVDWAFTRHHEHADLVNTHFPDEGGIRSVIKALRALYKTEGRGIEASRDVDALLAIKEVNDEILTVYEQAEHDPNAPSGTAVNDEQIDCLPDPDQLRIIISGMTPQLFMRISEHKALHALAFARFAVAAHDIEIQIGGTGSDLPPAKQLLTTAANWCKLAARSTRPKAVDQAVLERMASARHEISRRISSAQRREINDARKEVAPPPREPRSEDTDPPTGSIEGSFAHEAIRAMNDLLWRSLTSWPLSGTEVKDFARIVRDVERYLTGSRNHSQAKGIESEFA
ncbi:hypothetical protein Rhow_000743 [Rhodococcus wratislaviensis]|uniref:Uncharacterized protein n=1 Tax=Rhodococcus wratislaviensis TaxID=44752 RepID=A0A402C2I9_RHOWR|nr:hypothetical protein [Rhodococcus wratislaviensis]GCE37859.1 hypothetical protein Rhow_000743 [Rhodococcus wratislaviensis]